MQKSKVLPVLLNCKRTFSPREIRIRSMSTDETAKAIAAVDELLEAVGLVHGRRSTRPGSWRGGERVGQGTGAVRSGVEQPRRKRVASGLLVVRAPWPAVAWLRQGFSTRAGGVSTVYGGRSLNLGWTKEDDPALVGRNRRALVEAVAGKASMRLVTARQFHSPMIRVVRARDAELETSDGRAVLRGDGLMTDVPGVLLGIQTADCVPVLVADLRQRAVAAFHAGWRGTLGRIAERGVGTMRLEYGSRPEDLVAAVGPAIGACCYAVGEEVEHEFTSQFTYAAELFSERYDSDPVREKYPLLFLTARAPGHSPLGPQRHLDLQEANRRQLLDAGLRPEAVTVVGGCTACARNADGERRYFSHRDEHGFAGRMMAVVGVLDP